MKILEISPQPVFQPRGTPFSVYHRTLALSKLKHKIDLVCYHIGNPVNIKNVKVYRTIKIPFIKDVKIGPSLKKIFLDIFIFLKSFWLLLTKKYDVIHVHEEAGLFGVIFKNLFKIPLIYDMHSSMSQQITNFNFSKNKFFIKLIEKIEILTINNANCVIVICPHLGETVKKINKQKKFFLIENTPMTKDIKNVPKNKINKIKNKYDIKDEKIILYTGTLEAYQGIDLLVESIKYVKKEISNFKLLIVGGSKEQIINFKSIVNKKKLSDYIIFTGQRPIEEMDYFLGFADILVSPRDNGTNTPLKIYSYLKSGVPIVATNLLTHTQVLNDKVSVLTKPNSKSYAKGIVKILKSKKLANELSKNAINLAKTKYSYDHFLKKTSKVYNFINKI
jgi:glycosyltransferase involved in cell wall biosynthesis